MNFIPTRSLKLTSDKSSDQFFTNSFLRDSSPANKSPRHFPAAVDVLPPIADLVRPGAEKLPLGPCRKVPHALAQPEHSEYLEGHAVPLAPRVLEGSLVKELNHNVLFGKELPTASTVKVMRFRNERE